MSAAAWSRLRRAVLERDKHLCTRCARPGRLEVHHVNGDRTDNDPARLTTLCRGCHIEIHRPRQDPAAAAWRRLVDETFR